MSNYKYNKYKNKYINYKNQSGGVGSEDTNKSIPLFYEKIPILCLKYSSNIPKLLDFTTNNPFTDDYLRTLNTDLSNRINDNNKILIISSDQYKKITELAELICKYSDTNNPELTELVEDLHSAYDQYNTMLFGLVNKIKQQIDIYKKTISGVLKQRSNYTVDYNALDSEVYTSNNCINDYNTKNNTTLRDTFTTFILNTIKVVLKIKNIYSTSSSEQERTTLKNIENETINFLSNKTLFLEKIQHIIDYLNTPYNDTSFMISSDKDINNINNKNIQELEKILAFINTTSIDKDKLPLLTGEIIKYSQELVKSNTQLELKYTSLNMNKKNLYDKFKDSEYLTTVLLIKTMVNENNIGIGIDDINSIPEKLNDLQLFQKTYEIQENIANSIINKIRKSLNMAVIH